MMPADRTERKPTAYERICAEACEWCRKGTPLRPGEVGQHYVESEMVWGDRYPFCTAPSRDAVIVSRNIELADLTAELARVTKERDEANSLLRLTFESCASAIAENPVAKGLGPYDGNPLKAWHGFYVWLREKLAALKQERDELRAQIAKDERAHLSTIDERDATEDWFGKLAALFGVETEFSNLRGYADIYNDCAARTAQQEGK